MGERLAPPPRIAGGPLLERRGDRAVEDAPALRIDRLEDGLADQPVGELEVAAPRAGRPQRLPHRPPLVGPAAARPPHQPALEQQLETHLDDRRVLAARRLQQAELEAAADDAGQGGETARRLRQGVEAAQHHGAHVGRRRRHRRQRPRQAPARQTAAHQYPLVAQQVDQLGREERQAGGARGEPGAELGGLPFRHQRGGDLLEAGRRQTVEPEPRRPAPHQRPPRVALRHLLRAPGGEDPDRPVPLPRRQPRQQLEGAGVGEVEVVEQDDERPAALAGQRDAELGQRRRRLLHQPLRPVRGQDGAQRLGDRQQRRRRPQLAAAPLEDERAPLGQRGVEGGLDQAALADAGLALDQGPAGGPRLHLAPGGGERRERPLAPDQRHQRTHRLPLDHRRRAVSGSARIDS